MNFYMEQFYLQHKDIQIAIFVDYPLQSQRNILLEQKVQTPNLQVLSLLNVLTKQMCLKRSKCKTERMLLLRVWKCVCGLLDV